MSFFHDRRFTSLVLSATLMSSLTVSAGPRPIFEAAPIPTAPTRTEKTRSVTTLKDAKGNLIRLSNKFEAPDVWAQRDLQDDGTPGTSTAKVYSRLILKTPAEPIIVAVIDSGVDVKHPDLAGMIYVNEKEANGLPGVDNDGDGYVGNAHGWNFIGNKDGTNLGSSNLEIAREVSRLRKLAATRSLTTEEQAYQTTLEADYQKAKVEADDDLAYYLNLQASYLAALELLTKAGLPAETLEAVTAYEPKTPEEFAAKTRLVSILKQNADSKVLAEVVASSEAKVKYYLNLDFDPSSVIGDNPNDLTEKFYGNSDVRGLGAEHGTHCSGIIGALRTNGIGMDGQSNFLKIMPIRAVPDGDERDKDIANSIRYAVDHGARVISMSFGKPYSPNKDLVDSAVEYALAKGVLLVHAAGNNASDNDQGHNFPTAALSSGTRATNWLEVGASSKNANENLPAKFSNYGATMVDLFAPGKDIYSTTPDGTYAVYSGTSMAAPQVAGIAALLMSQNPSLTGPQVRDILNATVTKFPELMVNKPTDGSMTPTTVLFSSLSATGGIVNALKALLAI